MFQKVSGIPSLFHCAMAIFEAAVEAALRRATPSNHGSTVNVCCFRFGMLEPSICYCTVCRFQADVCCVKIISLVLVLQKPLKMLLCAVAKAFENVTVCCSVCAVRRGGWQVVVAVANK